MSETRQKAVRLLPSGAEDGLVAERTRRLAELARALDTSHTFQKGQFVRWKTGLKNRKMPAFNEPVIVREVLAAPVFDGCDSARCAGSPDFGEPLTLVLAIVDPDGDFVEFRYDGRRFEPAEV